MPARSEAFKARRRERRQAKAREEIAREAAAKAPLRAAGHCCGDCKHSRDIFGLGLTCDLDWDRHGHTPVQPDHLCSRWGTP